MDLITTRGELHTACYYGNQTIINSFSYFQPFQTRIIAYKYYETFDRKKILI